MKHTKQIKIYSHNPIPSLALVSFYTRAAALSPHNGSVLGTLASFLGKTGALDRADAYFRRGMEVDPQNPNLLGNFASFCHRQRNDVPMAIAVIEKSLKVHPNHVNNLSKYATLLKLRGPAYYDEAEKQYGLACARPEATATVLCNYATFLYVG